MRRGSPEAWAAGPASRVVQNSHDVLYDQGDRRVSRVAVLPVIHQGGRLCTPVSDVWMWRRCGGRGRTPLGCPNPQSYSVRRKVLPVPPV